MSDKQWVSVAEAAQLCGISYDTMRGLITQGAVPSRRIGQRKIRLRRKDVMEMLLGREDEADTTH